MSIFEETRLLYIRHTKKVLSFPFWLFLGLMNPVLYLLLYMPLLRNLGNTAVLPLSQIAQIFVPGMLVIMALGGMFAGFGFIPEIREGLITRFLVTPTRRSSILISYIASEVTTLLSQSALLIIISLFLGLRTSFLAALLSLVLVLLIGTAATAFSLTVSIATKKEDGLATLVNTIYLPIMLLSGIMLPISLAPSWLKTAAHFNPFYYAVEATRALFLGDWGNLVILEGFVIMAIFAAITIYFAVRSLKRMAA